MKVKIPFSGGPTQPIYDQYGGRQHFKSTYFDGVHLYAEYSGPDSPPEYNDEWPPLALRKKANYNKPDFVRKLQAVLGSAGAVAFLDSADPDTRVLVKLLDYANGMDFNDPDTLADFKRLGLPEAQENQIVYDL